MEIFVNVYESAKRQRWVHYWKNKDLSMLWLYK